MNAWWWLPLGLAIWLAVSVPVALFLGMFLHVGVHPLEDKD